MPKGELSGVTVLVTRPKHQTENLCALIEQAGGEALRFPTIEIRETDNPDALNKHIDTLPKSDIVIFVSPNAAEYGAQAINRRLGVIPSHLCIIAMGEGTARELKRSAIAAHATPVGRAGSEVLLNNPILADVSGKTIVIFRGDGGRPLLGDTLRERGAQVDYAVCYQRAQPQIDPKPIQQRGSQGEIDIITLTSVTALDNLLAMLDPCDWIKSAPSVVFSQRIADACHQAGFSHTPVIVDEASDQGVVHKLVQWRRAIADSKSDPIKLDESGRTQVRLTPSAKFFNSR